MDSTTPSAAEVIVLKSGEQTVPTPSGHNNPPQDVDPLADWTEKQLFIECIWASDEPSATKLFLRNVADELDDNAQSGATSYSRIAARCSLHESTTKKIARRVVGNDPAYEGRIWLNVDIGGGFYVEGKGWTNLYTGISPQDVIERVRAKLIEAAGSPQTTPYPTGVAQEYPATDRGRPGIPRNGKSGVAQEYWGSPQTTHYSLSKEKGKEANASPSPKKTAAAQGPHMNCSRFVIDAAKKLYIEPPVLDEWRRKFPHIPDLEALLQSLSVHFVNGGQWLKFREFPQHYFAPKLAADNKRLAPKAGGARKKSKRGELDAL